MRERIEDLGRLSVLLRNLLDHELFEDSSRPYRPKDCGEWWQAMTPEQQDETLRTWAYGIESFEEKLYQMLEIAEGTDSLNQPDE